MDLSCADPKGLIRESYRIEGITLAECRSIFVDWALSLGAEVVQKAALERLIGAYAQGQPGHPMSGILAEALAEAPTPQRRGGRAARIGARGGAAG